MTMYAGVTTNAIILCAYAIGNAAGPFMWLKKYQPRNHIPWAILSACSFTCAILILTLRFMLAAENKRRDTEPYDDKYDNVYIIGMDSDGKATEKKVDKVYIVLEYNDHCLELTALSYRRSWTSPITKIGNSDTCFSSTLYFIIPHDTL